MTEEKKHRIIWIHTPCRDGRIHWECARSHTQLEQLAITGQSRGFSFGVDVSQGTPNVPRQRNWAVAKAESVGAEGILFVDSDIAYNAGDALSIFEMEEEIIGISHQARPREWGTKPNMSGCFIDPELPKRPIFDLDKDLIQCYRATTGFLYIKMSVFRKIREAGLVKKFYANPLTKEQNEFCYDYFTYQVNDSFYEQNWSPQMDGEDWEFAVKCKKAGVKMWLEPLAKVTHYEGATAYHLGLHEYWTEVFPDCRMEYLRWFKRRQERWMEKNPELAQQMIEEQKAQASAAA